MPFPFESGWVNKIRNIDPNQVTPDDAERLQSILSRLRKWNLFPEANGHLMDINEHREIYFYFLQDQPGAAYQETYIGFLAPTFYEERHGEAARMQGRSKYSITSRKPYPMELVLNINKRIYEFNPDAIDDLNQYDGGTYRRAYIPGASQDGFGKVWIVEFEETWNCREVWFEKTEAIRRCILPRD